MRINRRHWLWHRVTGHRTMHQPCSVTSIPTHPVDRDAVGGILCVNIEIDTLSTSDAGEGGIALDLMTQSWSGQTPILRAGTRILSLDRIGLGHRLRLHDGNRQDHDQ